MAIANKSIRTGIKEAAATYSEIPLLSFKSLLACTSKIYHLLIKIEWERIPPPYPLFYFPDATLWNKDDMLLNVLFQRLDIVVLALGITSTAIPATSAKSDATATYSFNPFLSFFKFVNTVITFL
ncbi:hypothetical protein TTE2064 [Caldanaerobacter subterraneus subsp. tengcongensis MB4]|uniref:Uncharacterized protein n=1 Tax=Caldanaerobacter subterraneus subsp. tengcongensis (strain DSM 15242 / JCM 11007 / NBRC 100824 / MB4) TaxID=273068 RepID=Q8R8D9_CALS4|nr:hypothetical protein TTE2064 [Caldanaerobacter subterraneus subsp. tengcongensis MB4]